MMKPQYILGVGVIFVIIIAGLVAYPSIGNPNIHRFELLKLDLGDGMVIQDALCFFKVTNTATVGGVKFDAKQSPFSIDNPRLSFIAVEDNVNIIDGFIVEPKIKCISGFTSDIDLKGVTAEQQLKLINDKIEVCKNSPHGDECNAENLHSVIFEESQLSLEVISEDKPNGNKITTFVKTFNTDQVEASDGSEVKLAEIKVNSQDLEDDLSVGHYTSWQEFRISGTIKMHPTICPNCSYTYYIPEQSVPTYHQVIVTKQSSDDNPVDIDGDGVPDKNKTGQQNDAVEDETTNKDTKQKSSSQAFADVGEFVDCGIVQDEECLAQEKFAIIWMGLALVFGLIGLGILFSIINRRSY